MKFQCPKTVCWFQRPYGTADVSGSCDESLDFLLSSEKYYSGFSKTNIPV